jgi:adenylate cyclase
MLSANLGKKLIPHLLSVVLVALSVWLAVTPNQIVRGIFKRIDYLVYDIRYRMTLPNATTLNTPIAIIDIDEKSLSKEGRWPWSREKIAKLLQDLRDAGALVIAFDVIFAEPERNVTQTILTHINHSPKSDPKFTNQLQVLSPQFDNDALLAKKISERSDVVLGVVFHGDAEYSKGVLPKPLKVLNQYEAKKITIPELTGYTTNIDLLQKSAAHSGFLTTFRDDDGVVRRSPLIIRYGDSLYPSLALEAAKVYIMANTIKLETIPRGNHITTIGLRIDNQMIPTDSSGQVIVPYQGIRETFKYYSATDVLNHQIAPKALQDALVFVGTSSLGLGDLQTTPIQNVYPGVEVHATIAYGIIENIFPVRASWANYAELSAMIATGIVLSLLLPVIGPLMLTILSLLMIASYIGLDFWLWSQYHFVFDISIPVLQTILLMLINLSYGFLFENRKSRVLRKAFSQYVPPAHVKEISENPDAYSFEGESRELTVLFADIRNFTSISETLDASQLKQLLNRYFTPMTEIIFRCGGTIDKYVGDMIMAFWGAPVEDLQHREHALEAALNMVKKTEALQDEFRALGIPDFHIGIGLNTGNMNVGDMGSEFRRSYTVLGDAVNLGSRIEGTTKFYGVKISVGEQTQANQEKFLFRKLDRVKVKGKQQAVEVYECIGWRAEASPELLEEIKQHERAISLYFAQQWDAALTIFSELRTKYPNTKIYHMLAERIQYFKTNPPGADWDGAHERLEK